jgi:hypothetical protein
VDDKEDDKLVQLKSEDIANVVVVNENTKDGVLLQ